MTFVRCPNCQQAYKVRRTVIYAEPFFCSACGCHFNYGGAHEPRLGAVEEVLRLPGQAKVLKRASAKMPTIRPPAELREIVFDAGYDVRRLMDAVRAYPTVLTPPPPEDLPDEQLARIAANGSHAVFVDGRLYAEDASHLAPEELPEGYSEWTFAGGNWRCLGGGLDIAPAVNEFIASYGELMDGLRRRVAHVAVRLTARDFSTDPDIPQDDMNLPLEEGEGLLWRGLTSDTESWLFLTDRRLLYFEGDLCREYPLEAVRSVWSNWRDHGGVLYLTLADGEEVRFAADEIWRPALYVLYRTQKLFKLHFWTNDQEAVVRDLCDSLCNPLSFQDAETWPTDMLADSFVFADLFGVELTPRWRQCQW